jgi:alkylation response protein AidB-like acyl-CoA dehydrogenase
MSSGTVGLMRGLVTTGSLDGVDVGEIRSRFRSWLTGEAASLRRIDPPTVDFNGRVEAVRQIQRRLYDAGWLRCGWPVAVGGFGGDARHRAVIYDELGRVGLALRGPCEHLEIMAEPLVRHWRGLDAATFSAFLRGDELWCQGFSEPDAGSDLASLRTRAVRDGDAFRISGEKIWTSWAGNANRCLLLARTGSRDARHRTLSAFFVDLSSPGIEVRRVRQGNGSDELAQVLFDDVEVPADRLVGGEGDGFAIALDVLGCERSSFAWLRHAALLARADELVRTTPVLRSGVDDAQLGDLLLDLYAVRSAAAEHVERLGAGAFPGPEAAVVKVLLTRAEQQLYDTAYRTFGRALPLGSVVDTPTSMSTWQEEYLFSRAVSIYGGTRQVQLTTIARFVLGLPTGSRP